ncbi:MAG: hypothetical protein K2J76_07015 [Oscillospiraceae bacterium]|nr:hypothetical protein [Oscillospiraceae bacterium]
MRRARFLCTAICALSICGLMLTGCEKGNENTEYETEISETTAASESVSETTPTEAETVTEITEAEEIKEYDPVPKSTLNYDNVKDRIIFDDGENTLTAGQYIDALENCEEFTNSLGYFYALQLMDMDENGIPEILIHLYVTMMSGSRLYVVTADGKADAVKIIAHDIYDNSEHDKYYMRGNSLTPYEKDGETLWISDWSIISAIGGNYNDGEYVLKYDGSVIDCEVIAESGYETYGANDENGNWEWYRNDYYYIFGEEVTKEEYDRHRGEYLNGLQPSDALYVKSAYKENEFRDLLAAAVLEYIENS